MHTHPLLIKSHLEQQIRAGIKTQTRRTTGLEIVNDSPDDWELAQMLTNPELVIVSSDDAPRKHIGLFAEFKNNDTPCFYCAKYPYGNINTLLWCKTKQNNFIKKIDAQTWVTIDDITVERLQDITEADCIAEGVELAGFNNLYKDYTNPRNIGFATAKQSFKTLIDSIHGPALWLQNPWVWVTKFTYLPGFKFTTEPITSSSLSTINK